MPTPKSRKPAVRRLAAVTASVLLHGTIPLALLLWPPTTPPEPPSVSPPPAFVTLFEPPPPPPPPPLPDPGGQERPDPPAPAKAPTPAPVRPQPRTPVRLVKAPPDAPPLPIAATPTPAPTYELSEADLAGATTAGDSAASGGSGGGDGAGRGEGAGAKPCNMVRRLQNALRTDPDIQSAVARAGRGAGAPIMVWNGDWIRDPEQEGKGLAGVRQAIVMEIAFAPEACRKQPVRGLVLLTMNDARGSTRLVLGAGQWRWTDLLSAHR